MEVETILLYLAIACGFYMAWSIGANDVANAMGTSVGSGALTIKRAVIIAAILEFAGAFLVGTNVSETIRKGIINPEVFQNAPLDLVFGMVGALLAAAIWLQVASYYGWPVSTTHSIVGAVLGFGAVIGGIHAVDWEQVGFIFSSWIVSPLLSGTIAFLIFTLLRRFIFYSVDPVRSAKRLTPYIVFFVFAILTLTMVFKGLKNLKLDLDFLDAISIAIGVGILAAFVSFFLVKRIPDHQSEDRITIRQPLVVNKNVEKAIQHLSKVSENATGIIKDQAEQMLIDLKGIHKEVEMGTKVEQGSSEFKTVERIFAFLQILSASFVAFAHGANDVANAVGPLAAVIATLKSGVVDLESTVPVWVLGLGGVGIVFGLATWGWRVMATIGKKITELTPTRGFAAATTIVLASKLGLPISTTHTLVGAVIGVGLARGIGALNLQVVVTIIISWIITIPIGAIGAIFFYYIFKAIFG